ncbi:MAG: hypothetical protein J0H49_24660 [Acidobacteria bacterium]|nr:hypothetical protein [Acidobacteriota bacterium]
MSKRQISCVLCIGLALAAVAIAGLEGSYVVPLDHAAIQYATLPVDDAVARLQKRIDSGNVKLRFREGHGYLESILEALTVRPASQVLVFSKTSFQATRIAPKLPRAIYFNDNVAVGWVRGGDVLEFAAVDPRQGVIFYTLDQEATGKPHFDRQDTCLQCHQNGSTVGVPGLLVRSVYPSQSGMPVFQAGSYVTDHRSPLKERWGGWYVTGKHGAQTHMGNAIVQTREGPVTLEPNGQNVTDLRFRFDTGAYLTPHSDIVALMVLEHQTRMTNLITRVGFEARLALHDNAVMSKFLQQPAEKLSESTVRRINSAAEELVKYMLFAEETRLTEPVTGVSGFAESFARQGPRDGAGRSLREFDLKTRLFRYPCSYLIYSEAFDQMPQPMKDRVYQRLWQILSGQDETPTFASLSSADRRSILEILRATRNGLPDYWTRP